MLNLFGLMPLVTGYLSGGGDTGAVAHLTWGQDIKGGQGDGARSSGCDTAESAVSEASGAGRVARASTEGTASGKRWWRGRRKNRDRDRESLEDFKMRCELGAGPPVATGHRMSVDRPMCMGMSPSPSAARLDAMS